MDRIIEGATRVELERMREALLDWFAEQARDLPWRASRDPYAIWISEAMLQQTQVATVLPYFARFLERFPDVEALARADDDALMGAWSGLGYYSRARSLRSAAQRIVEQHAGRFPSDRAEALALPGVGPYTAGAVLSIAFGLAEPLVDGNVARVLARVFELEDPLGGRALERRLWALAAALLPAAGAGPRGPGALNQALMELGATVCTRSSPDCAQCPLAGDCRARAVGRTAELPRPKPRPVPVPVELQSLLVRARGRLLLARRPEAGRMAGLLELPTIELESQHLYPQRYADRGLRCEQPLGQVRHGITRYRILAQVHAGAHSGALDAQAGLEWQALGRLGELPLTGMAKKILSRPFAGALLDGG